MDLNMLKDEIFEFLNEGTGLDIADIDADDRNNVFTVTAADGSVYEVECRQIC